MKPNKLIVKTTEFGRKRLEFPNGKVITLSEGEYLVLCDYFQWGVPK